MQKIYQMSDCTLNDARPLGMESKAIADSDITATSSEPTRLPSSARLGDESGSWTASAANRYQWLQIDLSERRLITAVATQGRKGSREYVLEYRISFSDDGSTWRYYTNEFSMPEVFLGNTESYEQRKNPFRFPIVARYIRFNPVRWMTRISMRVEVYGCQYVANTASFSNSYIYYDISKIGYTTQTDDDVISVRFRTDKPDGVMVYADSNQGDYIIIELRRGYLNVHINLGSTKESPGRTSLTGGSLLDDGQWHDVILLRTRKDLTVIVDRLETKTKTNGDFFRLDLDKRIYIGGLEQFKMQGIETPPKHNFEGCLENVVFNNMKLIRDASNSVSNYYVSGGVGFHCQVVPIPPMTFHSTDSMLTIRDRPETLPVSVSLQFRTYNTDGILIYTKLTVDQKDDTNDNLDRLEVKINKDGHIMYTVKSAGTTIQDVIQNIDPASPTGTFNDGLWHWLYIYVAQTKVNCTVDGNSKVSFRLLNVKPTPTYYIGGFERGVHFLGCMRGIDVATEPVVLKDIDKIGAVQSVTLGTCSIRDRCIPNPCEHGGVCQQDWTTFHCMCGNTGYTGVTCRISMYHLSCFHYKMYSGSRRAEKTFIDIDGSGVLKPFEVICRSRGDGDSLQLTETLVGHDSEEKMKVLGYPGPGSYRRDVKYLAELKALETVVIRAYECKQQIKYECINSRLLSNPQDDSQHNTYAWWVGRTQQPMHYWGGASMGTLSCECGLSETGCRRSSALSDNERPMCNCDSAGEDQSADSGYLQDKDHLPVMSMLFGDTSASTFGQVTKVGWHTLDKLECTGDNLFDNIITFRKLDASIQLSAFDARSTGDIWFQFKTTLKSGVLLHNVATVSTDFIQIRLLDGETIFFSYNTGAGTVNIEVKSASGLNDNKWHTIHIERNRKQATLKVDEQSPEVRGEETSDGYRTLDLNGPLVLGARVDNRDGFVGCIRGLMINGKLVDLRGMVERGKDNYGLSVGCLGKCDSNPCFHGGTCKEKYNGYECDCSYTPYRGWMCGREVGANFNLGDHITYKFDDMSGMSGAMGSHVSIGFATKKSQGILLQIISEPNAQGEREYMSIELDNNGGIKLVMDMGFGREEINTPSEGISYTNGQQHIVTVRREDNGRINTISVDDYGEGVKIFPLLPDAADTVLNRPEYMYIGNNGSNVQQTKFEGCIYQMKFDNIFPLKDAFQNPRPPNIKFSNERSIQEDRCGFEEITQPPDPVETRRGGGIKIRVTTPPGESDDEWTIGEKIGLGIGGAIILILLLMVVFYFLFRGGEYRTHEAYGADFTDNPDAALMYNQVGHTELSPTQEWFM